MSGLEQFSKYPAAKRAYWINLENLGTNVVSNPAGTCSPVGLTFTSVTYDAPNQRLVALIDAGVSGVLYTISIEFDLSNGEHPVFKFLLQVQD